MLPGLKHVFGNNSAGVCSTFTDTGPSRDTRELWPVCWAAEGGLSIAFGWTRSSSIGVKLYSSSDCRMLVSIKICLISLVATTYLKRDVLSEPAFHVSCLRWEHVAVYKILHEAEMMGNGK